MPSPAPRIEFDVVLRSRTGVGSATVGVVTIPVHIVDGRRVPPTVDDLLDALTTPETVEDPDQPVLPAVADLPPQTEADLTPLDPPAVDGDTPEVVDDDLGDDGEETFDVEAPAQTKEST